MMLISCVVDSLSFSRWLDFSLEKMDNLDYTEITLEFLLVISQVDTS